MLILRDIMTLCRIKSTCAGRQRLSMAFTRSAVRSRSAPPP